MRTGHLRKVKKVTEHKGWTSGLKVLLFTQFELLYSELYSMSLSVISEVGPQEIGGENIRHLNCLRWSYVKVHLVPHIPF